MGTNRRTRSKRQEVLVSAQDLVRQYETALQLVTPGTVIELASPATAVPSPQVVRNIAIGLAPGIPLGIVGGVLAKRTGGP
jgi:hypothetical protein